MDKYSGRFLIILFTFHMLSPLPEFFTHPHYLWEGVHTPPPASPASPFPGHQISVGLGASSPSVREILSTFFLKHFNSIEKHTRNLVSLISLVVKSECYCACLIPAGVGGAGRRGGCACQEWKIFVILQTFAFCKSLEQFWKVREEA